MVHSLRGAFHDNFPGFLGFIFFRKLAVHKTRQGTDKAIKHNGTYSIIHGDQKGVVPTSCYPFYYFLFMPTPSFPPLQCGCQSPLLLQSAADILCKIRRTRHRCRFRDPASDILGGPLLCWTLLFVRRRLIHWIRCYAVVVPLSRTPLKFPRPIRLCLSSRVYAAFILTVPLLC